MRTEDYTGYEVGPIRPPSEAYSLLIRLVRGCAWNKCKFCGFYRGLKFAIRPVAHVKQDIDAFKTWIEVFEGKRKQEIQSESDYEVYCMAANWYQSGMESVFFQDANSLLMKSEDMIDILEHLNQTFPALGRITTYARSDTIARLSDEALAQYAALGLNRFHIGMETGSDTLLKLVNKGIDKQTHIKAGQKAVRAGIEVSEFYMPGLGGREYAAESARETADALNQINPAFIRIRSMALSEKLDLYEDYEKGIFTRSNDLDDLREIRAFLEALDGIDSVVESDHILNILLELHGNLPTDKANMLGTIDRFFALPEEEQILFRLGRRLGLMGELSDLHDLPRRQQTESILHANQVDASNIDAISARLMIKAIPV